MRTSLALRRRGGGPRESKEKERSCHPSLPPTGFPGPPVAPTLYGAFVYLPSIKIEASYSTLIIAGLLVGVGTRYAGGCTSGHGVCGLSRLSPRSLVATLLFMAAGFITVYILRHLISA